MRRAERRAHEERAKARAGAVLNRWLRGVPVGGDVTPRDIGRLASVHCRPFSDWMDRGQPWPRCAFFKARDAADLSADLDVTEVS